MKIEKQFIIDAPQETVWQFITAPELVAECIPGYQSLEVIDDENFKAEIKVEVGPIKATFKVNVKVIDTSPPNFARYETKGIEGGRASNIKAVSELKLTAVDENQTEVEYSSDINITGRLGKFGIGVMKKKADTYGDEFVSSMRSKIGAQPKESNTLAKKESLVLARPLLNNLLKFAGLAFLILIIVYFLS